MTRRNQSSVWLPLRRLVHRFERRVVVLVYHRVAELSSDPWSLAVTPSHFREHLTVLSQSYRPISLPQLTTALGNGSLPKRSVVVTFDDGYADNLYNARPLMADSDVPATIFFPTGAIGSEREFWWDELDRLLLQPGSLPAALELEINGSSYTWDLTDAVSYGESAARQHRTWRAGKSTPTPRHALYYSLWQRLQPLPMEGRQQVLDDLCAWANVSPSARSTHRTLTQNEVVSIAQDHLIEIGAHTVSHAKLSALPLDEQRNEIRRSKRDLEELQGRPVASFAYPYGRRDDYTAETVALVHEAGFSSACSNFSGVVSRTTQRYELPRMYVHDCDGATFANKLSDWFRAATS